MSLTSTKTKSSLKATQIIPIVIIIGSFIGVLYFGGFFEESFADQSFNEFDDDAFSDVGKLTPTRDIEGTWKTTFATEFAIATDYQDLDQLADVGTENRTMTFTITGTGDEHIVLVDVEFTSSNRQLISGSGYTPDVSPMQLRGVINGTQLTLTKSSVGPIEQVGSVAVLTFTSTQMQGTWHDHWEGVWEQNVYTATNALKLMKQ